MLVSLGWIVGGFAVGIALSALLTLLLLLARETFLFPFLPVPAVLFYFLATAYGFQGTLLLAAWLQAPGTGNGDRRAGLGLGPIRLPGRVAILGMLLLGWDALLIRLIQVSPALRAFARSATPDLLTDLGRGGPLVTAFYCVLIVIVAPLAEELFFRGWLWEALRLRGHGTVTIMLTTATPWLLLHGLDTPARILFLLPTAILFSIARHRGGGVRASLVLHGVNNLFATVLHLVTRGGA